MPKFAKILNVLAFTALFFDYAVAMQPAEANGTRRMLQIYAKQLPTDAAAKFTAIPEVGIIDLGRA